MSDYLGEVSDINRVHVCCPLLSPAKMPRVELPACQIPQEDPQENEQVPVQRGATGGRSGW